MVVKEITPDSVREAFEHAVFRYEGWPLGCLIDQDTLNKLHLFRYANGSPVLPRSRHFSQYTVFGATLKVTKGKRNILAFIPLPHSHVHPIAARCAICGQGADGPFYCEEHK